MASPILPDILWLFGNSVGRAALDATVKPGVLLRWVNSVTDYVTLHGKFTKFQAGYLPIPFPPFFWDYKCFKCRFWQGTREKPTTSTCTIVEGQIAPRAWCTLWMPPEGVKPLTWVQDWMHGKM